MVGVEDDLVAALALDVCDKAHAAAVVLKLGPIQAVCRRETGVVGGVAHIRAFRARVLIRHAYSHGFISGSLMAPLVCILFSWLGSFECGTCQAGGQLICRGKVLSKRTG